MNTKTPCRALGAVSALAAALLVSVPAHAFYGGAGYADGAPNVFYSGTPFNSWPAGNWSQNVADNVLDFRKSSGFLWNYSATQVNSTTWLPTAAAWNPTSWLSTSNYWANAYNQLRTYGANLERCSIGNIYVEADDKLISGTSKERHCEPDNLPYEDYGYHATLEIIEPIGRTLFGRTTSVIDRCQPIGGIDSPRTTSVYIPETGGFQPYNFFCTIKKITVPLNTEILNQEGSYRFHQTTFSTDGGVSVGATIYRRSDVYASADGLQVKNSLGQTIGVIDNDNGDSFSGGTSFTETELNSSSLAIRLNYDDRVLLSVNHNSIPAGTVRYTMSVARPNPDMVLYYASQGYFSGLASNMSPWGYWASSESAETIIDGYNTTPHRDIFNVETDGAYMFGVTVTYYDENDAILDQRLAYTSYKFDVEQDWFEDSPWGTFLGAGYSRPEELDENCCNW